MILTTSLPLTPIPLTLMQVLAMMVSSVEGFCRERALRVRQMLGLVFRLTRASARIAVLLKRFRAGTLVWRKRAPQVPKAAVQCGGASDALRPPSRRYPLPSEPGWLCTKAPLTAIYCGVDLITAMQQPEMQALMRATPEVARLMRPIFRMLALSDSLLLIPPHVLPDEMVTPDARLPVLPSWGDDVSIAAATPGDWEGVADASENPS